MNGFGGGEARLEDQLVNLRGRQRRPLGHQPLLDGLGEDAIRVQPRAIVGDLDDDVAGFVERAQADRCLGRLAGGDARIGRLHAVIHAVAQHVHQRIVDVLDHAAIELRVLALQRQVDGLARFLAQVPDQPDHLLEGLPDGHHAHGHRVALQVARDPLELREAAAEPFIGGPRERGILGEDRLGDHQFAHHVDEVVELARIDLYRPLRLVAANGLTGACGVPLGHGDGERRFPGGGRSRSRGLSLPAGDQRIHGLHQRMPPGMHVCGRRAGHPRGQLLDHQREQVHRLQHDLELIGPHHVPARTRQVEEVLHLVCHLLHGGDPERPGVALDGMERAEDVVEQLDVAGCGLELQHDALDRAQVVERLGDEHARHLGIAGQGGQFVLRVPCCRVHARSSRCRWSNRQPRTAA